MEVLHKLEKNAVCVENVAYDLKRMCCIHLKSDSKPLATFLADRLEVKEAK